MSLCDRCEAFCKNNLRDDEFCSGFTENGVCITDKIRIEHGQHIDDDNHDYCILCGNEFIIGVDGNELGFCCKCSEADDFPYDLDKYYKDYDNDKVVFKGFETMSRGILEKYRK